MPHDVALRASVDCEKQAERVTAPKAGEKPEGRTISPNEVGNDLYRVTLKEKTGELFLAVDAAAWNKAADVKAAAPVPSPVSPQKVLPKAAAPAKAGGVAKAAPSKLPASPKGWD